MAPLDDEDAAAAFACKFRSMRRAFLVIVASLRDTLLTRVYVSSMASNDSIEWFETSVWAWGFSRVL